MIWGIALFSETLILLSFIYKTIYIGQKNPNLHRPTSSLPKPIPIPCNTNSHPKPYIADRGAPWCPCRNVSVLLVHRREKPKKRRRVWKDLPWQVPRIFPQVFGNGNWGDFQQNFPLEDRTRYASCKIDACPIQKENSFPTFSGEICQFEGSSAIFEGCSSSPNQEIRHFFSKKSWLATASRKISAHLKTFDAFPSLP